MLQRPFTSICQACISSYLQVVGETPLVPVVLPATLLISPGVPTNSVILSYPSTAPAILRFPHPPPLFGISILTNRSRWPTYVPTRIASLDRLAGDRNPMSDKTFQEYLELLYRRDSLVSRAINLQRLLAIAPAIRSPFGPTIGEQRLVSVR